MNIVSLVIHGSYKHSKLFPQSSCFSLSKIIMNALRIIKFCVYLLTAKFKPVNNFTITKVGVYICNHGNFSHENFQLYSIIIM